MLLCWRGARDILKCSRSGLFPSDRASLRWPAVGTPLGSRGASTSSPSVAVGVKSAREGVAEVLLCWRGARGVLGCSRSGFFPSDGASPRARQISFPLGSRGSPTSSHGLAVGVKSAWEGAAEVLLCWRGARDILKCSRSGLFPSDRASLRWPAVGTPLGSRGASTSSPSVAVGVKSAREGVAEVLLRRCGTRGVSGCSRSAPVSKD